MESHIYEQFLRIKGLLALDWIIEIKHISRHKNRVADHLAKKDFEKHIDIKECNSYRLSDRLY